MIKRIEKYGATWCGPCRTLEKTLATVLKDFPEIDLIKYDADENEEKFEEKQILNVPQVFLYDENGKEIDHFVGALSSDAIRDLINKYKD